MPRFILTCLFILSLAACSGVEPNPTVYPFQIDNEAIEASSVKKVVIANVNLGIPSRNYLKESEGKIDGMLSGYLRENDFQVVSGHHFAQAWKIASRVNGDPYDPTTGKVNQRAFALNLQAVTKQLVDKHKIDAIIFTDIVERDIQFSNGLSHLARWDGITRKPSLRGPGDGVTADFDWSMNAKGASLWVSIYNVELQRLFTSIGGLDSTEAIDTRSSSGRYTRRRNILENETHLLEGIQLAMHPFIAMEKYPGKAN